MRSAAKLNCHLMLPVVDLGPLGPGPLVPPAPRGPAIVIAEIREFLVFVHSGVGCLYLRPVVLPKKKVFTRMELDDVILHVI